MTKDKALRLALKALLGNTTNPISDPEQAEIEDKAITAIKEVLAQPEQKPVAIRLLNGVIDVLSTATVPIGALLYTAPPRQEWFGLTEEEKNILLLDFHGENCFDDGRIVLYQQAIEDALREKNGG